MQKKKKKEPGRVFREERKQDTLSLQVGKTINTKKKKKKDCKGLSVVVKRCNSW